MVKRYGELYLEARRALRASEGENASFVARELLGFASGKSAAALMADRELYASEQTAERMEQYTARALQGEPLAYILGKWSFYGLELTVTPDVLTPRDDTMAVTELAIGKLREMEPPQRVLDLCTGSGCIGLALASRLRDARVTLADLSGPALAVARKNIQRNHMGGRVSCVQLDATEAPPAFLGKFDMIVSNPPYVTGEEMEVLPDSVRNYEPHMALFGGADGLDFYRAITKNYRAVLKPGGFLCYEFGMGQGDAVCAILEENGFTVLERTLDYNERERAVLAQYGRKGI